MKNRKTKRISAIVSMILVISMMCSGSVWAEGEIEKTVEANLEKSIENPSPNEFLTESSEKADGNSMISTLAFKPVSLEVESNNIISKANLITLSSGRSGVISATKDEDWYLFRNITAGKYRFDMSDIPLQGDYDMILYNSVSTELARSAGSNKYETIIINLAANTSYYLRVYPYNGTFNASAKYNVTVTNDACALLNWSYPFRGNTPAKYLSSPYGQRVLNGKLDEHLGIDIAVPVGTPIISVAPGTIKQEGVSSSAGNYLATTINASYASNTTTVVVYMHMKNRATWKMGQSIQKGAQIGLSGDSSTPGAYHLHFQVNTNGSVFPVKTPYSYVITNNPLRYFPNINFTNVPSGGYTERSLRKGVAPDKIIVDEYEQSYYCIDSALINFVGEDKFNLWYKQVSGGTGVDGHDFTVLDFVNYFNISNEKFKKIAPSGFYDIEKIIERRGR